jgi:MFS family permease
MGRIRGHGLDLTPLRTSADFRRLFAGQAISEFGSQITFVAVPFQVYDRTGSTAMVGLLGLTELVPLVVLPMVGGAIADAVERRRFLMISLMITAALTVTLAANAFLPAPRVWPLFAFSFLWASAYSLYSPAFRAWPARLLTPDLYTSALALEVVYYQSAALAGPWSPVCSSRRSASNGRFSSTRRATSESWPRSPG